MKKYFVIAICCIAMMFSACTKPEEPVNEQFLGNYSGKLVTRSTITFPWDDSESDISDMDLTMNIVAGNENNTIVANCTAYGQNFVMNGTIDNGTITFAPATITAAASEILNAALLNLIPNLSNLADANVTMTFDYTATMMHDNLLNKDYLQLDGKTNGNLTVKILGVPVACPINGTSIGRVNKQ